MRYLLVIVLRGVEEPVEMLASALWRVEYLISELMWIPDVVSVRIKELKEVRNGL